MSKTTAPLLSFGASGQVGRTIVYGNWKGRPYARRHVVPFNPQSDSQNLTRNAFTFLQAVYKYAPAEVTSVWEAYAQGKVMTARNGFTKLNLGALRQATSLDLLTISGGARGGPPPVSMIPTPGSGQLSVAVTVPTVLPTDWEISSVVAAALPEQDPHSGVLYNITAGSDDTPAYVIVLEGLANVEHQVRAWIVWERSDGSIAYSPDIAAQATPDA